MIVITALAWILVLDFAVVTRSFRATLCLLWTTLNTIIIATYLIEGSFTAPIVKTTAFLVPFVLAGIVVGEKIHDKVDERTFSITVFGMLFLTAIFMLIF
ncbi:MAG TPA: hypothetical protein VJ854_06965 [Sphaerochaeta sp.]|nr:hypothetical protein [Sphaerochaeta sp.]